MKYCNTISPSLGCKGLKEPTAIKKSKIERENNSTKKDNKSVKQRRFLICGSENSPCHCFVSVGNDGLADYCFVKMHCAPWMMGELGVVLKSFLKCLFEALASEI